MDSPEAAGGEDPDAAAMCEVCRGCDGRGTQRPTGQHTAEVANARLDHVSIHRHTVKRVVVQADPDVALDDSDRCGYGAAVPHGGLDLPSHPGAGVARG